MSAEYRRGRMDALREALAALDGHSFSDTAHARVRRLIDAETHTDRYLTQATKAGWFEPTDVERDEFGRCVGCLYSAGHAVDCPLRPQAGGVS